MPCPPASAATCRFWYPGHSRHSRLSGGEAAEVAGRWMMNTGCCTRAELWQRQGVWGDDVFPTYKDKYTTLPTDAATETKPNKRVTTRATSTNKVPNLTCTPTNYSSHSSSCCNILKTIQNTKQINWDRHHTSGNPNTVARLSRRSRTIDQPLSPIYHVPYTIYHIPYTIHLPISSSNSIHTQNPK